MNGTAFGWYVLYDNHLRKPAGRVVTTIQDPGTSRREIAKPGRCFLVVEYPSGGTTGESLGLYGTLNSRILIIWTPK